MIKNERQYWLTRSEAERFERLLTESEKNEADDDVHPLISKAGRDASNSRLLDLKAELQEYESLKSGKFDMSGLMIVTALPELLIKARIARGMTQRDLAERIGFEGAADTALRSYRLRLGQFVADNGCCSRSASRGNVTSTPHRMKRRTSCSGHWRLAFEAPLSKKMDFRFEVRSKASIYIRKT